MDVTRALQEQLKTVNLETESKLAMDLLAFQFLDNYGNQTFVWGGHYQPSRFVQTDSGHEPYRNPGQITHKVLQYWQEELDALIHPVLCTRFSGLLYEFNKTVTGKKISHLIAQKYATALIETVESKLYTIEKYAEKKLTKALDVASSYDNTTLINQIKN